MHVTETLEAMIDRHGLLHVIIGLELVCSEKATFAALRRDKPMAKAWLTMAKRFLELAKNIPADIPQR